MELTLNLHSMVHEQRVVFGNLLVFLSGFDLADDGCTTTCIVIAVLGRSPKGALHCAMFLSFSRIFPPLISLTSLAVFGTIVLSQLEHHEFSWNFACCKASWPSYFALYRLLCCSQPLQCSIATILNIADYLRCLGITSSSRSFSPLLTAS